MRMEQQTNKEEVSIPGRPVFQTVLRITARCVVPTAPPFIENESSAVNGIGGGGGGKAAVGQGILWSRRRRRRKSNSICVGKGGEEEEGKLPLFLLLSFPPPSSSSFGGGGGSPVFRLIVAGKREIYFPWEGEGRTSYRFFPFLPCFWRRERNPPPPPFFAKPFSLSFIWGIDCGRAYH